MFGVVYYPVVHLSLEICGLKIHAKADQGIRPGGSSAVVFNLVIHPFICKTDKKSCDEKEHVNILKLTV